jgi:rhodanese-related sulfurtransferase
MKFEITAKDYQKLINDRVPHVLLDVRQNWEVQKAKLAQAKHIPLPELLDHADELEKDQKIIIYCHHGIRSLNACFFLRELGFKDVLSLAGGIEGWSHEVDSSIPQY